MRSHTRRSLWPYVGVLLSLFVFSLAAPRAWRRVQHHRAHNARTTITREHLSANVVTRRDAELAPSPHHDPFDARPTATARSNGASREVSFEQLSAADSSSVLAFPSDDFSAAENQVVNESPSPRLDAPTLAITPIASAPDANADDEPRRLETSEVRPGAEAQSAASDYWAATSNSDAEDNSLVEADNTPSETDDEAAPLLLRIDMSPTVASTPNESTKHDARSDHVPKNRPPIVIPSIDLEKLGRDLVDAGKEVAESASQSIAILAESPQWLRDTLRADEPDARNQKRAANEPSPLRLSSPSDRLAMRVPTVAKPAAPAPSAIESNASSSPIDGATTTDSQPTESPKPRPKPNFFPESKVLIAQLQTLSNDSHASDWADRAIDLLRALTPVQPNTEEASRLIKSLAACAEDGRHLAQSAPTSTAQLHLYRMDYALVRRVDLFHAANAARGDGDTDLDESPRRKRLNVALEAARELTAGREYGEAWRKYLLLGQLAAAIESNRPTPPAERLALARQFLKNVTSNNLSPEQQEFLRSEPVTSLRLAILHWAEGPVDIPRLVRRVESYEATGAPALGQAIEADRLALTWSPGDGHARLVKVLEHHYRNANVRVAVAGDFLNRLIPQPNEVAEPVRDHIAGASVAGQSHTTTNLSAHLVPDPEAVRITLRASGSVASHTSSTSGPATFRSAGHTSFVADKTFIITSDGLQSEPAVADAQAGQRLRGVRTRYDNIPLVNDLARSYAINEHDKARSRALAEIESRVERRASDSLDQRSSERVSFAMRRFRESVLKPIESLALNPETLDLHTTENRAVVRMRLTGAAHIAAHTPRPRAPSDSAISIQLHESALNNTASQLGLNGATFTLPELHQTVWARFGRENVAIPDDLPRGARVTFARHDPVRVEFREGRLHITLSIDEIEHRRTSYRDFQVRAIYGPRIDRLRVDLERDGVIAIDGAHLRPGSHMALQGIFVKVFSKSQPISLIPAERNDDARLDDLMVTQCVFDDGWFGLAVGPQRSKRVAQLRRR